MVILFSIIAALTLIGAIAEGDKNKDSANRMTAICCASILAAMLIVIFS